VNPESEGPTELSAGDVEVHYELSGPVAAALAWAEMVLDGRLADAWSLTGSLSGCPSPATGLGATGSSSATPAWTLSKWPMP
jgi:hypothetical protein